jgi:hypothetical protein
MIAVLAAVAVVVITYLYFRAKGSGVQSDKILSSAVDATKPLSSKGPLTPSYDQAKGLTFSYTCWILVEDFSYRIGEQKVIFTKGPTDLSSMCPGVFLDGNTNSILVKIDTFGAQAEYIRNGLNYNKWVDNVNKVLSKTNRTCLTIMSTYNAFSLFNYDRLIYDVYTLKQKYNSPDRYWGPAVLLDTSYLRYPLHQTVQILPEEYGKYVLNASNLADGLRYTNNWIPTNIWKQEHIAFNDLEISKIKRTYDWMISPQDGEQQMKNRYNFVKFVDEHDRRRGTNFTKTFPELEDFYNDCKKINF